MAGNAVRQFNDTRFLGCCTLHQTDNRRQSGRIADLRHLDQQRALDIDRPSRDRPPRALPYRRALPSQQRLVGTTLAFNDLPVRRNRLARSDQNDIATPQIGGHHLFAVTTRRVRRYSRRDRRHQPGQCLGDADRALAGGHFQKSTAQQKEDEHRHRIEIDLATGSQRRPDAGCKGSANPQCHRHIHSRTAQSEIAPGIAKEGRGRIADHRHRQDQTGPAQQLFDRRRHLAGTREIDRHGIHHHLHHAETGDEHPPQRAAPFLARQFLASRGIVGISAIADRRDRRENVRQLDPPPVPAHPCTPCRVIDIDCSHPGEAAKLLLVEPDARRTGDPLENQRGFALVTVRTVAENPHEAFLEIGVIVESQALDDRRQSFVWRIRQGIAMTVVVG
ncbi:MAG: hypothetical protein CAPSK01_001912 [Candidatus Accumulibacter vicinus]|uniref:Uncharacterized protein n=1 Tax=Candidatus Accumulibacter vicinus TaxID=2954382 RepID=A0A084Y1C2_9PROT|nr:MAG: hypothetical protein CAPSK01_001912 [Candidatus Accumulibacter vicinus]